MARQRSLHIKLTSEERILLEKGCKSGNWRARKIVRAKVLLFADIGEGSTDFISDDAEIAKFAGCSKSSVGNIRREFQNKRLGALEEKHRSGRPRIVDGEIEAHLIAVACSSAPEGRERWTVRLIADRLVELVDELDSISYSTVGKTLKKTNLNLGSEENGK